VTSDATREDAREVVDFDHWSEEFLADRHAVWAGIRRRCPVAHNQRYGGFWVVSGYCAVAEVARSEDTFSSEYHEVSPDGIDYIGNLTIPRAPGIPMSLIGESGGILHQTLRRAVNPYMLPPAVNRLRPWLTEVANWFLDQKIEEGQMDLVLDYVNPVPAIATLRLLGLPGDDWEAYSDVFHSVAAYPAGTPEYQAATAELPHIMEGLLELAHERRSKPQADLMSDLAQLKIGERGLSDEETTAVLWNLVSGGLETTSALTSLTLHYLASHPEQRRQLSESPDLLTTATEEFLRYFTPVETLTRTVLKDVRLGGQQLRRGEHLLVSWVSADRDETEFFQAGEVVLDRAPNRHLAFGLGEHCCIGMHLARVVFQILVKEALDRLGEYTVDETATRVYATNLVSGVSHMPISFTPGPRLHSTGTPPF
jgi:cytochrome P450